MPESGNHHGSWFIGSAPQHPRPSPLSTGWNGDEDLASLNKASSSSSNYTVMDRHSSWSDSNSASPIAIQPTPSPPQLSPASSALSSFGTSRLSTPWTTPANTPPTFLPLHILSTPQTTPLNTPPSFIPLPILSEEDYMPPKHSQVVTWDVCHVYLFILFY
jgi:hypothetical protein